MLGFCTAFKTVAQAAVGSWPSAISVILTQRSFWAVVNAAKNGELLGALNNALSLEGALVEFCGLEKSLMTL